MALAIEDLKPGLYRITKETKNPALDRRVNSDWRVMHFPEGGVLLCVFRRSHGDEKGDANRIELQPVRGALAGSQYPTIHALTVGWQRANATFTTADSRCLQTLLSVLERIEPRDVDDALVVFNGVSDETITLEKVALTLLDESKEATESIFQRTAERLARFSAETHGENWREHETRMREFNAKAYKPQGEPAGDPEPEFFVRKGGAHVCQGCAVLFTDGRHFTAHLPCRGPRR